jgi:hypothetical protein
VRKALWVALCVSSALILLRLFGPRAWFFEEYLVTKVSSCQEVEVPERWRIRNMDPGVTGGNAVTIDDYFELRNLHDQIAIAVKSASGELFGQNVYSEQKYSFALSHPTALKPISEDEWYSAPALIKTLGAASKPSPAALDSWHWSVLHWFDYKGHQFRASGNEPASQENGSLLSPGGRWLAVQSFDGKEEGSFISAWRGMFYVDVFDVVSGSKRFTVQVYCTHGQAAPQTANYWLNQNYLFLDVFSNKRKFILCDAQYANR